MLAYVELLLLTFSYLDVSSFLNLTSTCKALHKPDLVYDSAYWATLVRTAFRVPNKPNVQNDGERWQKLFKRMLTQSKLYTWGNNEKGCLGHSYETAGTPQSTGLRRGRPLRGSRKRHIGWPEKMLRVEDLGVISDLQCGGWSTTLLTHKGALYTTGVIDGRTLNLGIRLEPVPLRYPPGFPHPYDRYDPSTAVKQFSAGRAHILALSDSGRIWSWHSIEQAALHVKMLNYDTTENGRSTGRGAVKKVVAGWNKSAALIEGTGIVLWEPLERDPDDNEFEDAALVLESIAVPMTNFRETRSKTLSQYQQAGNSPESAIGEVRNFIVLEEVVVFNTNLGKVFVSQILWDRREQRVGRPIELEVPSIDGEDDVFVTDVQGSYRSFGIFTRSGAVLTSKQDRLLNLLHGELASRTMFTRIPALQHRDVIQLAFGDYHFHALHSPGYITSYGTEPQACGALGLGNQGGGEGRLRGIRNQGAGGDGRLIPHAYTEGRRVWFEREKRAWIEFLTSGGVDPAEAIERERMAIGSPGLQCQGEVSEFVEQQGRDWETKFGVKDEDEDGLGAYFALSVTAAGWHSGALVLENDHLVEKLKRACEVPDPAALALQADTSENETGTTGPVTWLLTAAVTTGADWGRWVLGGMPPYNAASAPGSSQDVPETSHMAQFRRGMHPMNYGASPRVGVLYKWANDHFPRLKLSDGTEMPGVVPLDDWRYRRPEWDLDFTPD
ncbi:hypothetical protein LTR37_015573 [Vermiconidia calcicola]|uniref:Uncharacterized protein n=1 Tax=Vermiconidia calcicola TaxID=1690605 RepID=A0ACC3MRE0_9PEZI|nr:hypothetical protein LTR37_015573 [Vermiconidia calcicola]